MTSPPGQPGPDDRPEQDPDELAEGIRTGRIPVVPGSLVDFVMQSGASAPRCTPADPGASEPERPATGMREADTGPADDGLFSPGGRPAPAWSGAAGPPAVAGARPFDPGRLSGAVIPLRDTSSAEDTGSRKGGPIVEDTSTGTPTAGAPTAGTPAADTRSGNDTLADDALTEGPLTGDPLTGDPLTGDPLTGDTASSDDLPFPDDRPAGPGEESGSDTVRVSDDPAEDTGPAVPSVGDNGFTSLVGSPGQWSSGTDEVRDHGQVDDSPVTAGAPAAPAASPHTGSPHTGPPHTGSAAADDTSVEQPDGPSGQDDGPGSDTARPDLTAPVTPPPPPLPRRRDPRTPDGRFPVVSGHDPDQDAGGPSPGYTGPDGPGDPEDLGDPGDLGDDPLGVGPLPPSDPSAEDEDDPPATPAAATPEPTTYRPPSPGTDVTEPDGPTEAEFSGESPKTAPGQALLPPISPAPTAFEPFPAESRQSGPPASPPEPDAGPDRSRRWPPLPGAPLSPELARGDSGDSGRADRGGPSTDVIPAAVDAAPPRPEPGSPVRGADPALSSLHDGPIAPRARPTPGARTGRSPAVPPGPSRVDGTGAAEDTGGGVQSTGGNRPMMPGRPRPGDVPAESARLPAPPRPMMPGRPPGGGPDDRPGGDRPGDNRSGDTTGGRLPPRVNGGLMLPPGNGGPRTAGHRRVTDSGPSTAVFPSPARPDASDPTGAPDRGRRHRASPGDGPAPHRTGATSLSDPSAGEVTGIIPPATGDAPADGRTGSHALAGRPQSTDAGTTADAGPAGTDAATGEAGTDDARTDAGTGAVETAATPAPEPVRAGPPEAIMSATPRRGRGGVSPGGLAIGLAAILLAALTLWAIASPSTPESPAPSSAPAVSPAEQALRPAEVPAAQSVAEPRVRATVPVADDPAWAAAAPSGRFTYVAAAAPPRLLVLDSRTDAVAAEVPLPGPPGYVSVSPDGSRAYVSITGGDGAEDLIGIVDTATNRLMSTAPTTDGPLLAVPSTDGHFLYVAGRESGRLDEVDAAAGVVTRSVPVAREPAAAAPSPDGDRIYLANSGTGLLTVLDPGSLTVLGAYKVSGDAQAVTAAPGGGQIAVAGPDDDTVSIMDPDSGRELATARVDGGPSALAWAPDGRHLYVGAKEGEALRVVDTTTWQVVGSVPTDGAPTSVTVSPDGRTGWVTATDGGKVTVLNLS